MHWLCTFHGDLLDLFGFLINPLLPPDFLCCAHQFLQLLDLLVGSKWEHVREKPGKRSLASLGAQLQKSKAGADDPSHTQHAAPPQHQLHTLPVPPAPCRMGLLLPADLQHGGKAPAGVTGRGPPTQPEQTSGGDTNLLCPAPQKTSGWGSPRRDQSARGRGPR